VDDLKLCTKLLNLSLDCVDGEGVDLGGGRRGMGGPTGPLSKVAEIIPELARLDLSGCYPCREGILNLVALAGCVE
jgi:hypothetical protein